MTDQATPQGQELTQEEYVAQAQTQMALMQEHIRTLAEANKALVEGVGDQEYTFTGHANFYMFLFGGKLSAWADFNDGTKLHFAGEWYGVGIAAGSSWGGGTFGYIPPSEIVGHCTFEVHNAGLGPGALQINWVRGKQLLGTYLGGGIGGGGSVGGGSGTWNYYTDGN